MLFWDITRVITPFFHFAVIYSSSFFFQGLTTQELKNLKKSVTLFDKIKYHLTAVFIVAIIVCVAISIKHEDFSSFFSLKVFLILWIPAIIGVEIAIIKYYDRIKEQKNIQDQIDKKL